MYCTILIVCKSQSSSKNKRINTRFTKVDICTSHLIATSPFGWEYFHLYTGGTMAKTWRWVIIGSSSFRPLKNILTCSKWWSYDRVPVGDHTWGGLLECCCEKLLFLAKDTGLWRCLFVKTLPFLLHIFIQLITAI